VRLGGDEFATLLPGCDEHHAAALAGRLRSVTPTPPGASVGFAVSDGHETSEALMARSDAALYAEKRAQLAGQPSA
jgi:GGDEF domain-containing protein